MKAIRPMKCILRNMLTTQRIINNGSMRNILFRRAKLMRFSDYEKYSFSCLPRASMQRIGIQNVVKSTVKLRSLRIIALKLLKLLDCRFF